jgi:hypothetical protein
MGTADSRPDAQVFRHPPRCRPTSASARKHRSFSRRATAAPGAKVRLSGQIAEIELESVSIRISFDGFEQLLLLDGEVSDRYGVRNRAPVLTAGVAKRLPARVGYRIESIACGQ